jgi:hypothetical protein
MVLATSPLELNNMKRCIFLFSLVMERALKGEKTLGRKVSVNGPSSRSAMAIGPGSGEGEGDGPRRDGRATRISTKFLATTAPK